MQMKKNFVGWGRFFVSFLAFCMACTLTAQKYVTCTNCGGTGVGMVSMYGSMPCMLCSGKGKIIDAYSAGKAMGLVANGKAAMVRGDYATARQAFSQAINECEDASAAFFYGVCLELGMGCQVDRDAALAYYEFGQSRNDANSQAALNRIASTEFWVATDDARNNFRQNLKMQMDMEMSAIQMSNNLFKNTNSAPTRSTRSSRQTCTNCKGTGRCPLCNGEKRRWVQTGDFVGKDIKRYDICGWCRGSGLCGVCHGAGKI